MALIDFAAETVFSAAYKGHWGVEDYVFSTQTKKLDQDAEADDIDGSAWGNRFSDMQPAQQKASVKVDGLHSGVQGQVGHILRPMVGATSRKRWWHAGEGLNVLAPATFMPASLKKYSTSGDFKGAQEFSSEWSARGDFNSGFILVSPKTTNVLSTASGNGTALDNTNYGGATTFGGVAQMHIYDIAGGTSPSVTVVVQHSVDGTTWTTLGSFVAATPLTKATTYVQRIRIPSTTTVNAHVRAQWTTAGTPTGVQGLVMFARGVDPDA